MSNVIVTALASDAAYLSTKNNPIIGYHNVVEASGLTSTTALDGYPVSNLANSSTALVWKGDSGSTEYITVVTTGEVDYMAIARHNMFTAGCTLSVEYYDGSSWVEIVAAFVPEDDEPILIRFPLVAYGQVRLKIQNATVDPYIAIMYVGQLLVLQRRIFVGHSPARLSRKPTTLNAVSENGNFLGRITVSEMNGSSVQMQNLDPEWYRELFDPFLVAARDEPFFFAWRPYDFPDELSFAWLTDMPQPSNQLPNGMMSVSFSFTAIQG